MIIDGDSTIRETIRKKISEKFSSTLILEAKDGSEGLFKMERQKFDLVITDLGLAKIDGRTLIQKAQLIPSEFSPGRFIVTSGNSDAGTFTTKFGKVEVFSKPVQWELLLTSIETSINANTQSPPPQAQKPQAGSIDVEFINPFIDSTLMVLLITAGIKVESHKITIKSANQASSGDISSIIAMNSQVYLGSMAISFEQKCFLSIVNGMLGENYTSINDENRDAASELCNQIYGGAKKTLNEKGHTLQPAIPTVVVGKSHQIKHSAQGPVLAIEFTTAQGKFTIEAVTQKRVV